MEHLDIITPYQTVFLVSLSMLAFYAWTMRIRAFILLFAINVIGFRYTQNFDLSWAEFPTALQQVVHNLFYFNGESLGPEHLITIGLVIATIVGTIYFKDLASKPGVVSRGM